MPSITEQRPSDRQWREGAQTDNPHLIAPLRNLIEPTPEDEMAPADVVQDDQPTPTRGVVLFLLIGNLFCAAVGLAAWYLL